MTDQFSFEDLDNPTKWPSANARLLGLGVGLPVHPLDRLANFNANEFERFMLEWADGYLRSKLSNIDDIQQRGGAGDKGRDIVVWFGEPGSPLRHWHLYQCKKYAVALGPGKGIGEIAKVLFFAFQGDFTLPFKYWFVTRKGVTGEFQDLIDDPEKLRTYVIENWDTHCKNAITSTKAVALEGDFADFVHKADFGFIRVKQPLDFIKEHAQTSYHLVVFGAPLIERTPPATPPSDVVEAERVYVGEIFKVIGEMTSDTISKEGDFAANGKAKNLFERSRMSFYSAEALKELARDQMADAGFFDKLLGEFRHGLYYTYSAPAVSGYERLSETVKAAHPNKFLAQHSKTIPLRLTARVFAIISRTTAMWHGATMNELAEGTRAPIDGHRLFNTPLECGFRLLFALDACRPNSADLQRLISYDYLLVHSNDIAGGPPSLHPPSPFGVRGGSSSATWFALV